MARSPENSLFRLSVAENASGLTEEALTHMRSAIDKGYEPIHERVLLAKYLGLNGFEKQLDQALAVKHSQHENTLLCQ